MMGGNNNAKTIEKNNCSMFNWIGIRNIACIITSIIWLAIFNWSYNHSSRTDVALLLNSDIIRGGNAYDNCCKKSSKIFERNCKIDIWN